jgi:RecA/RadA recombinase
MPRKEVRYLNDSDEPPKIKMRTRKYPIIATGLPILDEYLLGGFRKDALLHFYGDPGAGKTTLAMQVLIHIMQEGWKGIWVDCNGAFSLEKFQVMSRDANLFKRLIAVQPRSFSQQTLVLQQLKFHLEGVGVIVVDPITHHYRTERFQEASQGYFQELVDTQLGTLVGISHMQHIPIIVINYATRTQNSVAAPLVAQGFARVEHYRLYFTTLRQGDDQEQKCVTIELAPEKYSQNRAFTFEVTQAGIRDLQLLVRKKESEED